VGAGGRGRGGGRASLRSAGARCCSFSAACVRRCGLAPRKAAAGCRGGSTGSTGAFAAMAANAEREVLSILPGACAGDCQCMWLAAACALVRGSSTAIAKTAGFERRALRPSNFRHAAGTVGRPYVAALVPPRWAGALSLLAWCDKDCRVPPRTRDRGPLSCARRSWTRTDTTSARTRAPSSRPPSSRTV
jgi:hypothetical protein